MESLCVDTLAQDYQAVVNWKTSHVRCVCCWWRVSGPESTFVQGPEPIAETEVQPNFQYVEYKRVLVTIPVRPTPVIVLLVFPSWFPRVFLVSLIVGTVLYLLL